MIIGDSLTSSISGDSQSSASKAKLDDELNRFLILLVTQLKNQDPLDPLSANDFTSQLVQFASVEQQIFANANLEKLLNLEETNQISAMVNFIGTTIEAEGRKMPLENSQAQFTYTMPAGAASATIIITNGSGLKVFTFEGDTSSGKHTFTWDGRNDFGVTQSDGDYNILVSGLDFSGNLLEIPHTIFGRVTGAGVDDGEASLFIGENIVVSQDKLRSVKETETSSTSTGG